MRRSTEVDELKFLKGLLNAIPLGILFWALIIWALV